MPRRTKASNRRGSQAPGTAGGMVPPRGCPHAVRGASEPRPAPGSRQPAACRRMPRCRCCLWAGLTTRAQRAGRPNVARRRLSPSWSPVPVPENAVARHGESSTCGSPLNASAAADGQMLLGAGSRRPSPKSLPFWQLPSCSLVRGPCSRCSRRARKSHFCRNTYVNGHFSKARVF